MVISILTRKTRIIGRDEWRSALDSALPKIRAILEAQTGFVSVEYLWSLDEPGQFAQITTWKSPDDCKGYIREGAAGDIATIEEAAVPTAAHPDGAWVRRNFETTTS